MKLLFLESKYKGKIAIEKIPFDKLPKKIGLVTIVQFVDFLGKIKSFLTKKNKTVLIQKAKQKYAGQLLGCDTSSAYSIKNKVNAFLYIGTGHFHPIMVGLDTK